MWSTDFVIHCLSICSVSQLCLVWTTLLVVSENMFERGNGQRMWSFRAFKAPSPEHPWHMSSFYCHKFYLAFSSCCCVRQKKLNKKLQDLSFTNTPTESIRTPQIQRWQNWKMSRAITTGRHNQMTLSDLIRPHQHIARAGFPAIYGSCHFCRA